MNHSTSQTGAVLQEFEMVLVPIHEAEPVERKGVPERDGTGSPMDGSVQVFTSKVIDPATTEPRLRLGRPERHPEEDQENNARKQGPGND